MTAHGHPPQRLYGVVHAGSSTTRYARAGSGTTVVLLMTRPLDHDTAGSALFEALSKRLRVIAPELPARASSARADELREVATWMQEFLDGLGIDRASLVMDEELALTTLGFTLADPARIARIALISRSDLDPTPELEVCMHALTQTHGTVLRHRLSSDGRPGSDDTAVLQHLLGDS